MSEAVEQESSVAGEDKAAKRFVWEVFHFGGRRPAVTRYVLVKKNPGGGVTVLRYGKKVLVRPAHGKRFFTDESLMLAHVRGWMDSELERHRSAVISLEEDLEYPGCRIAVEEIRDVPFPARIKLKDDE